MIALRQQFLEDNQGHKIAVLIPIDQYNKMLEQLEDSDDVRAYDDAKKEDDGKRILFSDYLKKRKAHNA